MEHRGLGGYMRREVAFDARGRDRVATFNMGGAWVGRMRQGYRVEHRGPHM